MRPDRLRAARERWERFRFTNALLAVDEHARLCGDGPLAGLLFSVKDVYATARLASTAGSLVLEGWIPERDATVVARLRRAGATLFAKANCAEFGVGIDTETRIGGRVRHPFDDRRTPGGSSGGDAVAVATGIVDFAVAGDYGGSVRWPAQAVGVFGLRTSTGLVPRTGRVPGHGATSEEPAPGPPGSGSLQGRLEVVGLLARHPMLLAEVLTAVAGADGADWPGQAPPERLRRARVRRLLVTSGREVAPVSPASAAALEAAVDAARERGYEIVRADGLLEDAYPAYARLREGLDDLADLRRLVAGREALLCPSTRSALTAARARGPAGARRAALEGARAAAKEVTDRVTAALATADGLLAPVAPVPSVGPDGTAVVDGHPVAGPELMAHCRAVSLTGLPALSLPVSNGPDGPASVQLVGPPGGDWRCCSLAAELVGPKGVVA